MKINFISQKLETHDNFGFIINQYNIIGKYEFSELLNLKKLFDIDLRPQHIKNDLIDDKEYGYLKGLFNSEYLSVDDFKLITTDSIYYYLEGFSESEDEWGEDKVSFKKLLNKFISFTKKSINGCYLINKEWFEKTVKR